jgi:hypothetical protein
MLTRTNSSGETLRRVALSFSFSRRSSGRVIVIVVISASNYKYHWIQGNVRELCLRQRPCAALPGLVAPKLLALPPLHPSLEASSHSSRQRADNYSVSLAQRNPTVASLIQGRFQLRKVQRAPLRLLRHEPPRSTRFPPESGPGGLRPGDWL